MKDKPKAAYVLCVKCKKHYEKNGIIQCTQFPNLKLPKPDIVVACSYFKPI